MKIFKLEKRDTWHIQDDKNENGASYCKNAKIYNLSYFRDEQGNIVIDGKVTVKNLEFHVKVVGNNFPKLCKACVQLAYQDEVISICVRD